MRDFKRSETLSLQGCREKLIAIYLKARPLHMYGRMRRSSNIVAGFVVLKSVNIKVTFLWDLTLCRLMGIECTSIYIITVFGSNKMSRTYHLTCVGEVRNACRI